MKRSELFFSVATVPLDYIALLAAALLAHYIRFLPRVVELRPVIFKLPLEAYFSWAALAALCGVLLFAFSGVYRIAPGRKFGEEFSRIALACSTLLAGVLLVMFSTRYLFESRFILVTSWFFAVIFATGIRLVIRAVQRQLYRVGVGAHRVALIGQGLIADELANEFQSRPTLGYRVVERFSDFTPAVPRQLRQLAQDDKIDEVVQATALSQQQTLELVSQLQEVHLDYTYAADLLGTKLNNFQVVIQAGIPLVEVKRTRLRGWGRVWKRGFDVVIASLLIFVLSPVLLVIGIAIVADSGFPVFFTYWRVGERAKRFRFIKFRSMVNGAHQLRYDPKFVAQQENLRAGTPMIKFKNDPRVTRVGRFLRRWSLDELPQLLLVVAGSMSLVGPRPHEVEEVARYSSGQRQILAMRPGMTGLAQVSGRSDLDFNEEVKLDSFYIQNWSPWLDLQILLKTPAAVLRRRRCI